MNKEIKRRSTVVGNLPNVRATARLSGAIPLEQGDESTFAGRRYFSVDSMKRLLPPLAVSADQEPLTAIA